MGSFQETYTDPNFSVFEIHHPHKFPIPSVEGEAGIFSGLHNGMKVHPS